ncbi:MAG: hypothetical protein P8Q36_12590 [Alphaproteobacteria bacterium]|nr:hypothetical protein [Alphaproteobacteria bacterium]
MKHTLEGPELRDLIWSWRAHDGVSFSVGVPGIVAEFHAMPGETLTWSTGSRGLVAACSGGSFRLSSNNRVLVLPYDLESRRPGHRVRGVLFC